MLLSNASALIYTIPALGKAKDEKTIVVAFKAVAVLHVINRLSKFAVPLQEQLGLPQGNGATVWAWQARITANNNSTRNMVLYYDKENMLSYITSLNPNPYFYTNYLNLVYNKKYFYLFHIHVFY